MSYPTFFLEEQCGSVSASWELLPSATSGDKLKFISSRRKIENKDPSSAVQITALSIGAALRQYFVKVMLPEGFPSSVSKDYATYQIFDTLQALCSSLMGTLSTRAILRGVGVGEAESTVLSGTLQWLLKDGTGMISQISVAAWVASDLDHDAKRWRLAADITNDAGYWLEVMSTHMAKGWFLPLVCAARVLRAVTAVAGGATRMTLTQHFAIRSNAADVAAKDGSQETAVNLMGMLLGVFVLSWVPETFEWSCCILIFFTLLHLLANYMGVTALILTHLNEERLLHCLRSWELHKESGKHTPWLCPSPAHMRRLEGVLPFFGRLR